MRNKEINARKKIYNHPEIVCVELDKIISLALESTPPAGPNEVYLKAPYYFNNDPFKIYLD